MGALRLSCPRRNTVLRCCYRPDPPVLAPYTPVYIPWHRLQHPFHPPGLPIDIFLSLPCCVLPFAFGAASLLLGRCCPCWCPLLLHIGSLHQVALLLLLLPRLLLRFSCLLFCLFCCFFCCCPSCCCLAPVLLLSRLLLPSPCAGYSGIRYCIQRYCDKGIV